MNDIYTIIQFEAEKTRVVNPLWIRAIIQQESAWNKYALRFEPDYKYLFQPEFYAKRLTISVTTEINCQKTSWGLGQIMLALAREQGHLGHAGELFEPEVNIHHIALRLKTLIKISPLADDVFSMYNGGPGAYYARKGAGPYRNQSYVDSVKRHLQTISI